MATTEVNVGFRPPRILTLIRPDCLDDLVLAARANTRMWGGIRNPIVTVRGVEDAVAEAAWYWADLVTTIQPPSCEQQAVIDRLKYLEPPPLVGSPFDPGAAHEYPYLDVRAICRHYFETTFRFGNAKSRAVLPTWDEQDPFASAYSVVFGAYGDERDDAGFEASFLQGVNAKKVDVGEIQPDRGVVTPLELTADRLSASHGRRSFGVVVGAPNEVAALMAYWNLRAAGCHVMFWPDCETGPLADLVGQTLGRAIESRASSRWSGPTVWCADSRADIPPRLAAILATSDVTPARAGLDLAQVGDPTTEPVLWRTDSQAVLANVESDGTRRRMFIPLPERPFSSSAPPPHSRPHWLVTLDTFRAYDLEQNTLDLPWIPALNPWASRAMLTFGQVRTGSRGVALFAQCDATTVELDLPHSRDVLKAVLALAGLTATTSPAGEAANRIIARLGGLWGCRHLRLHGVREVLSATTAWRFEAAVGAILQKGDFARYRNVPSAADELRMLIGKEALRPVLELRCPQCKVASAFVPADVADEMVCPRCGESFRLGPVLSAAVWKYRPSGFFADLKRHGAVPVVLTMIRLLESLGTSGGLLDSSLKILAPDIDAEIDCLALWRNRDDLPVMAVAECKGGQQQLTDKDLADLDAVAAAIRQLGIECYLIAATTRAGLTTGEETMLSRWRKTFAAQASLDPDGLGHRRGPIVLTADQLDYHEPFSRQAGELLPSRYVHGIADLAANMDAVMFGAGPDVAALRTDDERLI